MVQLSFIELEQVNITKFLINFVIGLLAFKCLHIIWNARHLFRLTYQCEGDFSWPFIGKSLYFGLTSEELYHEFLSLCEKYESPIKAWAGPVMNLIIYDPDDIHTILKHENATSKSFNYKYLKDVIGNGILTANHSVWKKNRKIVASTFNHLSLKSFVENAKNQSDFFVQEIGKQSDSQNNVDVLQFSFKYAFDTVLESMMGVNVNSKSDFKRSQADQYLKSFYRLSHIVNDRVFTPLYFFDKIFRLSKLYKEYQYHKELMYKLTDQIIEKNRSSYENEILNQESDSDDKSSKIFVHKLFRQLTHSNSEWSENYVRDEVITMIVAGTDTNAHTLSYVFLMLAMHPDVQQKVFEEIKSIEDSIENSNNLTIDNLNQLEYMNQVIMESMRLFSTVLGVGRYTTGDIQLKNIVIPKGVTLIILISALHRNKKYWGPNSDKFDPENFSLENRKKRHPHAFIPFLDGSRNCVGSKFANIVIKVLLFKFLRQYRVHTEEKFEDIRCKFGITLEKVNGWKVQIFSRHS